MGSVRGDACQGSPRAAYRRLGYPESMLDREQATFKHDPLLPEEGWIRTILEAQDGMLWIGVMGHGLLALDRTTRALKWYQHDSGDPRSLPTDLVKPVYETRDGTGRNHRRRQPA